MLSVLPQKPLHSRVTFHLTFHLSPHSFKSWKLQSVKLSYTASSSFLNFIPLCIKRRQRDGWKVFPASSPWLVLHLVHAFIVIWKACLVHPATDLNGETREWWHSAEHPPLFPAWSLPLKHISIWMQEQLGRHWPSRHQLLQQQCRWGQAWQPGALVECGASANLSLWLKCCSWLCLQSCGLHRCNPQHLLQWQPRWSALPQSPQRTCAACRLPAVPDRFCTTRFWSLVCHWFYIQAGLCPPASRTAKLQASWWTWEVLQNRVSM